MTDLATKLQAAISKAAEYEMLGGLATGKERREEYCTKARFYEDLADELRKLIANGNIDEQQATGGAHSHAADRRFDKTSSV